MTVNEVIEEFFNFEKPCPSQVPMCEKLREAYKAEVDKLNNQPGCSQCAKNTIKSRFMEEVWKQAVSSVTQPVS